jgi:hypothetical protein
LVGPSRSSDGSNLSLARARVIEAITDIDPAPFFAVVSIAAGMVFLLGAVFCVWHAWEMVAHDFPTWHVPTTSLRRFEAVCGVLVAAGICVQLARSTWRYWGDQIRR